MRCFLCVHCTMRVCRIYNLSVGAYDEMEYCPHQFPKHEEKQKDDMWPSKPIKDMVRLK